MLTDIEGSVAVKLARKTIESFLSEERLPEPQELGFELSPVFGEKRGVFVTLSEEGLLRGCIGHPYLTQLLRKQFWTQQFLQQSATRAFRLLRKKNWKG